MEQVQTQEEHRWTHEVTEGGGYQVGQAWVHLVSGDRLAVRITRNGRLEKSFAFDRRERVEPYDGTLFRFPLRLEKLVPGDRVEVACVPERGVRYELQYRWICSMPLFPGSKVFPLAEYGARGDGVAKDLPALWRATAEAVKAGGGIIRFERGKRYRLKVDKPEDFSEKQYVFQLNGARNIKFEGNDCTLVLHPDLLALMRLEACENILVEGFVQTFDPQPYYQGEVISIQPDALTAQIAVPPRYGVPLVGKSAGGEVEEPPRAGLKMHRPTQALRIPPVRAVASSCQNDILEKGRRRFQPETSNSGETWGSCGNLSSFPKCPAYQCDRNSGTNPVLWARGRACVGPL